MPPGGLVLPSPGPMPPLTVDTGRTEPAAEQVTDAAAAGDDDVTHDDVTNTSRVTSDRLAGSRSPDYETACVGDGGGGGGDLSPSPPKIPRLRIVMASGDGAAGHGQSWTASPGGGGSAGGVAVTSLPYVVTLADVTAADAGSDVGSERRDVSDDVVETSLSASPGTESGWSRQQQRRKARHGAASGKVRTSVKCCVET